jgi:histidyl-tRNA synthetase
VWRADRPARGRFREFYQCDVDAIGSTSPVVEAEMIAAVSEVLQTLGFTDFVVQLNHRELLTAMLDAAAVPAGAARRRARRHRQAGQDRPRQGGDDMVARGIDRAAADVCLRAFEDRPRSTNWSAGPSAARRPAERRRDHDARASDAGEGHVRFTPRLARGLSYYTGAIMEIAVDGSGSLGGGGRYDG